nr:unnamed protein product [Digitaria exilis]
MTGEGELQADSLSDGEKAKEGDVFFVPAYTEVKLSTCGPESMQLQRAPPELALSQAHAPFSQRASGAESKPALPAPASTSEFQDL